MVNEQYGVIGIMIGYLRQLLNVIADFFARIMGGATTAAPTTTAPAVTEPPVTETIIYRN